jgi:hypothetical protein
LRAIGTRTATAAAVALLVGVLVAACGDDDDIDVSADQDRVDAAVLTVDDLPAGFEAVPSDDPDDDLGSTGTDECLERQAGVTRGQFEAARTARSDQAQFEDASMALRFRVNAFRDADVPTKVIDAFHDGDFLDCLAEEFRSDPDAGDVELTKIESIEPLVSGDGGYQVRLALTSGGVDVESRLSAVVVDRFVVSAEATARPGDVDEGVVRDALQAMADRVKS